MLHGGAAGSGAFQGNPNALNQGLYTQEGIEQRKAVSALLKRSRRMLEEDQVSLQEGSPHAAGAAVLLQPY